MWTWLALAWSVSGVAGLPFYYNNGLPTKRMYYGDAFKGQENDIAWFDLVMTSLLSVVAGPVFLYLAIKTA